MLYQPTNAPSVNSVLWVVLVSNLAISCLAFGSEPDSTIKRGYTQQQVVQGKIIFNEHCAVCHGENAASVPRWNEQDKNGQFPPPPLNGTAHSWHHAMPLLTRTIEEGGVKFGGRMPAFKDKLSDADIQNVIAWFQSLWSDEIYARWSGQWQPPGASKKQPWSIKNLLKE